ncbi:MAG TPA: hypothetical protein VFL36_07480 [Myxococcales bacterium]|nr:hypothetical protein [Myxococcales bacterium]
MHRLVTASFAAAWLASAAAGAVDDAERQVAQCIDRYNVDDAFRAEQSRGIPENPGLILHLRPVGGYGSADTLHSTSNHPGVGGMVDADTLFTLFQSGHTRTGLAVGVSAIVYSLPGRSLSYGGELRLGLGRRRYGVPVFEPRPLRALQPSSCRFVRMDLRLDFVRWRLQGLQDLTAAAGDARRVSTLQLLVATQAHVFGGWSWTWSLSLADFQVSPAFDWGPSLYGDIALGPLVLSATVGGRLAPHPHAFTLIGLGLRFQFLEGVSLSG